jgi:hypothetical protein
MASVLSVVGVIPVESEASWGFASTVFEDAPRGRVCVRVFIGMSVRALWVSPLYCVTNKLARANSTTRFDKIILIYDLLFIFLKSLTLTLHVDICASILKLVLVRPNFIVWVWSWIGGWKSNSECHNQCFRVRLVRCFWANQAHGVHASGVWLPAPPQSQALQMHFPPFACIPRNDHFCRASLGSCNCFSH